jgi:phage baseplate assembly protein gpV
VEVAGWNPLAVEPHRASAEQPAGHSEQTHVGRTLADPRHAELCAQAELDRLKAAAVTFWGFAAGDPRLCPGTPVVVSGLDDAANGRYVPTTVTHRFTNWDGFATELATVPLVPPTAPALREIATFGVVTQIDDPRQSGRVRVRLPAYADVETSWMQVLLLGAGEGKGLMIVPAVGDRVLVLLPRGDAGEGVVLGGLVGLDGAADSGVEGDRVRRFTLQTPGGQRVQLDDAGNILRLQNSTGSYVELAPDHVHLYAAHDLTVEAPGKQIVIRGQTIDFERG